MANSCFVNSVFFVLCTVFAIFSAKPELGQLCRRDNIEGVCTLITDCPHDRDFILKEEKFDDCEPKGMYGVVCCSLLNRKPGVISKLKCAEYSKLIRVKIPNPTPLIGGKPIERIVCPFRATKLIIGGKPAGEFEFPHMALINITSDTKDRLVICGGSLISDQHILTAAHCIVASSTKIILGIDKINETTRFTQVFSIEETKIINNYKSIYHYNDLAIIKLDKKVKFSPQVRPACLYYADSNIERAIATGWGALGGSERQVSDRLMKVIVDVVPTSQCNKSYKRISKLPNGINSTTQICAGTTRGQEPMDTCDGDSGSPLQIYSTEQEFYCTYKIFGVTSFGYEDCGVAPGVYTRVPAFLKEIEDYVWPPS